MQYSLFGMLVVANFFQRKMSLTVRVPRCQKGVPQQQPHRHPGLATLALPSVRAVFWSPHISVD